MVIEPYDATSTLHHLVENADETFLIDNEACQTNFTHTSLWQEIDCVLGPKSSS